MYMNTGWPWTGWKVCIFIKPLSTNIWLQKKTIHVKLLGFYILQHLRCTNNNWLEWELYHIWKRFSINELFLVTTVMQIVTFHRVIIIQVSTVGKCHRGLYFLHYMAWLTAMLCSNTCMHQSSEGGTPALHNHHVNAITMAKLRPMYKVFSIGTMRIDSIKRIELSIAVFDLSMAWKIPVHVRDWCLGSMRGVKGWAKWFLFKQQRIYTAKQEDYFLFLF